jgi:WD40 repeat protein
MRPAKAIHMTRLMVSLLAVGVMSLMLFGTVSAQVRDRFEDMAVSPDGRLLAIASGAAVCHYAPEYRDQFAVHIVDRSSGQVVHELVGQACPVTSVSWHPDSTRLVTASIDGIRVWDVAQEIVTIHITNGATDQQAALRVFWSPDGRYIAYFGYQVTTLNLLDVETGEDVWALNVYGREPLTSAAWSHDSTKIATSAEESEIRVWSADTRELAQALDGHVGPVYSVAFSPDDTKLASGGADGTVRIWDIWTIGSPHWTYRFRQYSRVEPGWNPNREWKQRPDCPSLGYSKRRIGRYHFHGWSYLQCDLDQHR